MPKTNSIQLSVLKVGDRFNYLIHGPSDQPPPFPVYFVRRIREGVVMSEAVDATFAPRRNRIDIDPTRVFVTRARWPGTQNS